MLMLAQKEAEAKRNKLHRIFQMKQKVQNDINLKKFPEYLY